MYLSEIQQPISREEIEIALEPFLIFLSSGDQPLKRKHIAKKLEQTLKQFGVDTVKVIASKNVDSGDMNMNAAYDPYDDEDGFDPFTIDLIFITNS